MTIPERRQGTDRRSKPRGGRRPDDVPGFTPLVLVVDEDSRARELAEAILAKLHFAVTSAGSGEKARQIMAALHPDVIVARARDVAELRTHAPQTAQGVPVPVVEIGDGGPDALALVEDIRAALGAVRAAGT